MELPAGPSTPVLVQTLQWGYRPVEYLTRARRKYGDTFTMRLGVVGPVIHFSRPEDIRAIFTGDNQKLHAGEANAVLEPIVGKNSVLLLDDDEHLRQRRLLLPPFHGERMKGYLETIDTIAHQAVDGWHAGDSFPMRERTQAITLDVILQVIFGIRDEARSARYREYFEVFDPNIFRLFAFMSKKVPTFGKRDPRVKFSEQKQRLDRLILEEIELRSNEPDALERDDILSMLLQARDEDGNPMTKEELRDELITLVVAGHETTAVSLAWTFELLYRHPEVMKRATDEALGGGFEYIDAVIKESLRFRPILPLVVRRLKAPVEIGGYNLPAGVSVAANIYLSHMREDVYGDPEVFRPDRFLENPPDGYSWFPFGGGIRRCIGASFALFEMRVILQAILSRAALSSPSTTIEPIGRRAITFSPKHDARTVVDSVRPRDPARQPVAA